MSLILIVESSQTMAQACGQTLAAAGHECLLARSASEALSQFQEGQPDLVLTEVFLQEGDGLELLENIVKISPRTQVIVATGRGNETLALRALELGAFAYVIKSAGYLAGLADLVKGAIAEKARRRESAEQELQSRRLEAQNELSGWMAHNFKNILAAAMGYLHLVDLTNPGQPREKQVEFLNDCRDSLTRALGLLEQLEEMTRSGPGEAEKLIMAEEIDFAWARVWTRLRHAAAARGETEAAALAALFDRLVFLNATRNLPPQFLVRRDFASMMEALLQNAVEAVSRTEAPRVLVRGEIKNGLMELVIKDNGRGMDEKVLRHAMEPLFSTKGEVGVGISLSLVQSLINRHGGAFRLSSAPGQGASAKLTWSVP